MGDLAIPFFQLRVAIAIRFLTLREVLDARFGRCHLPVVSFFSCLDSLLQSLFRLSVDVYQIPIYCLINETRQLVWAAAPSTPHRASSNTSLSGYPAGIFSHSERALRLTIPAKWIIRNRTV